MSKWNPTIQAKVELEGVDTGMSGVLFMPISLRDFLAIGKQYEGKNISVKEVDINCDVSIKAMQEKSSDTIDFCIKLINAIQDLNMLSNNDEVQALTEYLTTDIEELIKFVKKGKFHFYPDLTFEDIEEGITEIGDIDSDEITIEDYNANGYFEASTGIIYIPEKSTKYFTSNM